MPNWMPVIEAAKNETVNVHCKHGDRFYGKLEHEEATKKWFVRMTDEESKVHRCYFEPDTIVTL